MRSAAPVAEEHEVLPDAIVLLKHYSLPKTSSGKVQRRACRDAYLNDVLQVVGRWEAETAAVIVAPQPTVEATETNGVDDVATLAAGSHTAGEIQQWLIEHLAARLAVPASEVDVRQPFNTLGLDSVQMVGLVGELEIWLDRKLTATMAWDYPTILLLWLAWPRIRAHRRARANADHRAAAEPIAVVGMACRFPGATRSGELLASDGRGRGSDHGNPPRSLVGCAVFFDANPETPEKWPRAGRIRERH